MTAHRCCCEQSAHRPKQAPPLLLPRHTARRRKGSPPSSGALEGCRPSRPTDWCPQHSPFIASTLSFDQNHHLILISARDSPYWFEALLLINSLSKPLFLVTRPVVSACNTTRLYVFPTRRPLVTASTALPPTCLDPCMKYFSRVRYFLPTETRIWMTLTPGGRPTGCGGSAE
jgi:hypothetical protein